MIKQLTKFNIIQQHYLQVDPKISRVLAEVNLADWLEDTPSEDHFYNLTRNIIYQQLAGKAASTIFGRFEQLLKNNIVPEEVLKFEDQAFRDVGLSWAKAKYVKDLASKVVDQSVDLSNLDNQSNEDVILELTKVKGIGRWTAEMFLLFTLHRENIFSYGDLGLKNGISKLYQLDQPTNIQIQEIVERWSPYETYGSIALWHHLDNR